MKQFNLRFLLNRVYSFWNKKMSGIRLGLFHIRELAFTFDISSHPLEQT